MLMVILPEGGLVVGGELALTPRNPLEDANIKKRVPNQPILTTNHT
jgi:hypothetical protein